ncbi:MAG TPA: hypothetical protein VL442_09940 [Mucilaginibacter sp.]|nr:hypothetical protein [Mucilaginibacter sp.]
MKNLFSRCHNLLFLYTFLSAMWMLSPFLALYGFIVETNNGRKNNADQRLKTQIGEIIISDQKVASAA